MHAPLLRFIVPLAFAGCCSLALAEDADPRPNILWISCEDISPHLGCYGDHFADTPNLDRLAAQGVRFTNCCSHAGVCAISRSGIITGMYPVSIGSQHMRSRIVPPPRVKCFTEYLRAAGYYCTNRSKADYNFEPPLTAWDENNAKSTDWRGRAKGQPFFCVINLTITHESQIRAKYDSLTHDPAKVTLPPYIPDTPVTRRDRARYYDLVTKMDRQAGEILDRLEADGLAENTIVMFWSDHGEGLPRGKRWLYDSGIRVPLIVRWPGREKPASVREDLVAFVDFAPTVLTLAGVAPPKHMQGRVFLGDKTAAQPEYLFGHRDRMDETYDIIRAVRSRRFKYLRNFETRRPYGQHIDYMDQMPTMIEMRRLHAEGALTGAQAQYFRTTKPAEELFDLEADPYEIANVADRPEHAETLAKMRTALEEWQVRVGDLGLVPEPLMMKAIRPGAEYATTAPPDAAVSAIPGREACTLTLGCATNGASIAWTTESGKNPPWKLYVNPVEIEKGTRVRAIACRLGFLDSPETTITCGPRFPP